jgi:hypothetical protein
MAPDKAPPLPVAADRAAISNRLAMLFADRSALIKKLVPPTTRKPSRHGASEDEDALFAAPANQGLGYASEKPGRDSAREDKILRGRLLGKRKLAAEKAKLAESESDEEQGRGSLGTRKRARVRDRERQTYKERAVEADEAVTAPTEAVDEGVASRQDDMPEKKKKRKKRRKNKGKAGEGSAVEQDSGTKS